MSEELVIYEGKQALIKPKRTNYELTSTMTGTAVTLTRDIDFGVIPKTKKPSLFKSGAEKVIMAYGLLQHYTIESKIEKFDRVLEDGKWTDNSFFMYVIRCDLVRVGNDGKEYVFTSGIGSANTLESRNGFNGAFNAANGTLKMAQKRAMVSAAVNIAGISSMFTMDIEDSDFVENGYKSISETQDPKARITPAQVKRLFALANNSGINAQKAKERLAILGYTKATEVTQEVYDSVCEAIQLEDDEFKEMTSKENKG